MSPCKESDWTDSPFRVNPWTNFGWGFAENYDDDTGREALYRMLPRLEDESIESYILRVLQKQLDQGFGK